MLPEPNFYYYNLKHQGDGAIAIFAHEFYSLYKKLFIIHFKTGKTSIKTKISKYRIICYYCLKK